MHSARLGRSPRLQRVLAALRAADGGEMSTREIVERANVVAVNSCACELRDNGFDIPCRQVRGPDGGRQWLYRLVEPAE